MLFGCQVVEEEERGRETYFERGRKIRERKKNELEEEIDQQ